MGMIIRSGDAQHAIYAGGYPIIYLIIYIPNTHNGIAIIIDIKNGYFINILISCSWGYKVSVISIHPYPTYNNNKYTHN